MHDQAESLRRRFEMSENPREAKTISFVSGKGGVGKSNVALNFSLELSKHNKKVILVDLDIGMGNVEILLGSNTNKTIVDMLHDNLSIYDIIETGPNNLSYISGGSGLSDIFIMEQQQMDHFFEEYHKIVQLYDYIIFDMGAGATPTSMAFVLASDECIVVTTPEPTSITDAYSMIKHIVTQQPTMPLNIVMNRALSQKTGSKSLEKFQQVILQFLEVKVKPIGILPNDPIVTTAVIRQVPYSLLNEKAAITKALKQMTKDYISLTDESKDEKPMSFIQKFKRLIKER
ncbi:flagellar biosynthesis protein FlhG [Oceanobacillus limi]|uniref:Flagellar biosynthesis protein FlhG n=1 Tax=Oceanobacillus limi TaxID=930131 RepID=A0A1H9Z2R1_9BACI|nr:MinD/ParA family protein [Oceanobacillus limi]SES75642.1 flagellar biosynthesis protein FlhG [Oceanobacillus limi]